ncbi:hypothetical protein [Evansella cellulosilytica]|uniref:Uncharacterized protein n=1 Tax=Evansella cellulosilytica (strain ATCC 21833 / DSM 2522 / FERM P-1141 / JCM 9156 / N-4) TaxID=649639 RepID=E6U0C9_EVAC2|nr:hypothetical protein [Evansella cellulosilytica]ADU30245.1 hypothetical protein Bcell_1983 [Evansella cellulosilytica DSM 2522]
MSTNKELEKILEEAKKVDEERWEKLKLILEDHKNKKVSDQKKKEGN